MQEFNYFNIRKKAMTTKGIENYDGIILGYYPLRGKIQICRLLCEYLHVGYKDLLFTPQTWEEFKATQNINWNYQELPFLKEKDFVVTETFPICLYIIQKANRKDLLGRSPFDEAKVDMFIWQVDVMSQILALLATFKDMALQKKYEIFDKFWHDNLKQKLVKIQNEVEGEGFYISYMTIVDFYIYDLWYFFKLANIEVYMSQFPKLTRIYNSMSNISEIMAYQQSNKAIKNICPAGFYQKWRSICVRQTQKAP